MRLRHHIADLVHGARDEVHKLKFCHRAHAGERGAERSPNDCRLGNGRINHALGTESIDKALGDFECAPVNAYVFAQAKDSRVALHLFRDSLPNSFKVSEYRHSYFFGAAFADFEGGFRIPIENRAELASRTFALAWVSSQPFIR